MCMLLLLLFFFFTVKHTHTHSLENAVPAVPVSNMRCSVVVVFSFVRADRLSSLVKPTRYAHPWQSTSLIPPIIKKKNEEIVSPFFTPYGPCFFFFWSLSIKSSLFFISLMCAFGNFQSHALFTWHSTHTHTHTHTEDQCGGCICLYTRYSCLFSPSNYFFFFFFCLAVVQLRSDPPSLFFFSSFSSLLHSWRAF